MNNDDTPATKRDVQDLKEEGWEARFVTSGPEFNLDGTTKLSHTFEINIPVERTAIPDGRIPPAELATPSSSKKLDPEVEAFRKWLASGR